MDVDPEISPGNEPKPPPKAESPSDPSEPKFQSIAGAEIPFREGVDVILSLNDTFYQETMYDFFSKLGGKGTGTDVEKDAARDAFELFKNRSPGQTARFFKRGSRTAKLFFEVDAKVALEKITTDVFRRMESSSKWMAPKEGEGEDKASDRKSPPALPQAPPESTPRKTPPASSMPRRILPARNKVPTQQASKKPPPPKSAMKSSAKRKLLKKVPQSLPFISNTNVASIIVEEENRAKKRADGSKGSTNDQGWQPDEVVNFFRGLYVHGWNEWKKVSKMVKTRNNQQVKSYALKLEKKFGLELKKFFSKHGGSKSGTKAKRSGNGGAKGPGGASKRMVGRQASESAMAAASMLGAMRNSTAAASIATKPKVVICLGEHVIDTEAEPSLVQPAAFHRKRSGETLPDYFDPAVRPSVPTNCQQIYIPGNKVYARWLNKDDPGSYGTWYPGFVNSSKLAPIQDEYNLTGVSNLLYHVKFDDGAESLDLDTEDIMMQDQYTCWLTDLEQYYSLPVTKEITWKRLSNNTRVYAKWNDPTDPELHGSWMLGRVHSSKTWEGNDNQWRHSYHICFDNGDQDEDVQDGDVVEEETYRKLIREKMERGRKRSRLSGFELITEASKISSPIKVSGNPYTGSSLVGGATKKKLYADWDAASDDDDEILEELRCNEVLESRPPSPTHVARLSSTPSPDVHYGIYSKAKPWQLDLSAKPSSLPQDQSKAVTPNGPTVERDPKAVTPSGPEDRDTKADGSNNMNQEGKKDEEDRPAPQDPPAPSTNGQLKEGGLITSGTCADKEVTLAADGEKKEASRSQEDSNANPIETDSDKVKVATIPDEGTKEAVQSQEESNANSVESISTPLGSQEVIGNAGQATAATAVTSDNVTANGTEG